MYPRSAGQPLHTEQSMPCGVDFQYCMNISVRCQRTNQSADKRVMYNGIAKKLTTKEFVEDVAVIKGCLGKNIYFV